MSIEVLTWVFKHSEAKLANRLVLLALADYAHDDGSKAFPSIPKLAAKARVSERTAIRCLQALAGAGMIEQMGSTKGGTKVYRVIMDSDKLSGAKLSGGDIGGRRGGDIHDAGGDNDGGALHREPSVDPSGQNRQGAGGADAGDSKEISPLSHLLQALLEANGVPPDKAKVTKAWADAERLMLTKDKRPFEQAEQLLRWATNSTFWRANILSMTGFREKYDQVRMQAERDEAIEPGAWSGEPMVETITEVEPERAVALWKEVVARLAASVPESTMRLWIEPGTPTGIADSRLVVRFPEGTRAWTERRYTGLLREALQSFAPELAGVMILQNKPTFGSGE